ncbi:hypothetical protein [Methylobacterium trifolii]|nr:hypothetical protein [Methylobacterium trifolii]
MRSIAFPLLVGSLAGLLAAGPASPQSRAPAQGRSTVQRMTCAETMDLVKREGAVVLGAAAGQPERFVRDRSFCEMSEIAELRFVPTRDNPQCPIGYRCREPGFDDWNWD